MKLYYSFPTLENPFWQQVTQGMAENAEAAGVQVELHSADDQEDRQVADLEKLVGKTSEVVAVSPAGMTSLLPTLTRLMESKVPVIAVDYNFGDKVAASIISGNTAGGVALGNFLMSLLGPSARIVHIQAQLDLQSAVMRRNSFLNTCQRHQLEVVATLHARGSRRLARAEMAKFLGQGIAFNTVLAENDVMALGAADALKLKPPAVWPAILGFDGIDEAIAELRQGRLAATVMQKPREMGAKALEIAVKILRGQPFEKLTTILTHLLTPDNVDQLDSP